MADHVELIEATDEEIAALDDEIDMWREWLSHRSEVAGAAVAIAAAIEIGEELKDGLPKIH